MPYKVQARDGEEYGTVGKSSNEEWFRSMFALIRSMFAMPYADIRCCCSTRFLLWSGCANGCAGRCVMSDTVCLCISKSDKYI